jgi:hypothetical protein
MPMMMRRAYLKADVEFEDEEMVGEFSSIYVMRKKIIIL